MRSLWAKRRNQIITFGFNKSQYRQMMLFDARSLDKPLFVKEVDQMSNIMMPFFDEDTNLLYVGGRGEAGIKYFEIWDEAQPIVPLQAFSNGDPQKGLAMMPKTSLDVKECQLAKFYKLTTNKLSTISFNLPRRQGATQFQSDIFPPTFAPKAAITAEDFFAGKNANPVEVSLAAKFEGGEVETIATSGQLSSPSQPSSPTQQQQGSSPAAASSSSATTTTTTTKPAVSQQTTPTTTSPVVTKDPIESLTEEVAAQQKVVESAKKALAEAEVKLADIEGKLKAEQDKKVAASATTTTTSAPTTTEETKTEETVAAATTTEETKTEETAVAATTEEAAASTEEKKEE
jgi:coronin-1B/1C/6